MRKILFSALSLALLLAAAGDLCAQQLRTSYFMDNSIQRTNMNPALRPARGYLNIPVIGGTQMNFTSNALTVDNIFAKKSGKVVTFLDESVNAQDFLSKVKKNNRINIDVATNILGFGFYTGKDFWTFDIGLKVDGAVSLPKELFEFAKLGSGIEGRIYEMKDMRIKASAYSDIAFGYSRKINDKLTVGGKLKVIIGVTDMDMQMDELQVKMSADEWKVNAKGTINGTMKGIKTDGITQENGKQYFDSFEFDSFGVGGFGFGIDLGASYQLLPQLTLSAAVVDLGLIKWSADNTITGTSAANYTYKGFDLSGDGDVADDLVDSFGDLTRFEQIESQGRTTSLRTTINIGGEYAFLNNRLSVGLLSSTQLRATETYSELTVSGNWRPLRWLAATVSYSCIHSDFKTIGCALNLSPSWINLYVGTDYILGKVTPQFVPIKQKCANFYFGIGIPIGKGIR